jgi:hypothetical protein
MGTAERGKNVCALVFFFARKRGGSLGWDGRLVRLKEEETDSRGGAASLLFWPSGDSRVFWKRWVCRFRVFFFVFFLKFQNCPLLFVCFGNYYL